MSFKFWARIFPAFGLSFGDPLIDDHMLFNTNLISVQTHVHMHRTHASKLALWPPSLRRSQNHLLIKESAGFSGVS